MKTSIQQKLFNYFSQEYDILLLEGDFNEIENILHSEDETDPWCKVQMKDGNFYLTDPNGLQIPQQRDMLISQSLEYCGNGVCKVRISLFAKGLK